MDEYRRAKGSFSSQDRVRQEQRQHPSVLVQGKTKTEKVKKPEVIMALCQHILQFLKPVCDSIGDTVTISQV